MQDTLNVEKVCDKDRTKHLSCLVHSEHPLTLVMRSMPFALLRETRVTEQHLLLPVTPERVTWSLWALRR